MTDAPDPAADGATPDDRRESGRPVALVTGASRGLGHAMALALGTRGWDVVALARTAGGLEELDDAIRAAGGPPATLVPLDLADDPALERLGAAIHGRWGRLDLLIHAAAEAPPQSPVEHIQAKDIDRALAVDARAVQRLIRVVDPLLRLAPAPAAVFFSDTVNVGRFHAAYAAAKAAGDVIVDIWADETARLPLRVLRLSPPAMPTAVRGRFRPGEDRDALPAPREVAERLLAEILPDAPTA